MNKLWFTAKELADLKVPGLPKSQQGVHELAVRSGWDAGTKSRKRNARGGGREYHVSLLPTEVQNTLALRALKSDTAVLDQAPQTSFTSVEFAGEKSSLKGDAKLAILMVWDAFERDSRTGKETAMFSFVTLYNGHKLPSIADWTYSAIPTFSVSSLKNWLKARATKDTKRLAGNYGNRKGTSLLDTAFDGKVAKFISAHVINQPHLNAGHIRDLLRDEFGEPWEVEIKGQVAKKSIPSIRAIQRWIKNWKDNNKEVISKITDPDGWKNKYMVAPGKANAGVNVPNQLWEIDASPVDAMCIDGRYNLYCVIDIYTRRMKILVSKTPTTAAALLLIRQAIMDWGVPETIRTDNGADFTSHAFVRALLHLGIKRDVAAPFTPEHKSMVERGIGTFQRGCMPLLPGFIGHDVTDRKQIEARKAFAQRLGEKDSKAFCVELNHLEVQEYANKWVENKYHHNPHAGLNKKTPYQVATAWTGSVRRIENEQSLHILLAEIPGKDGIRTVGKKGISIDGIQYWHNSFEVGQRVHVRFDPQDLGRVHCFSEDHDEFLCTAINPEYEGLDPVAMAAAAKAAQRERLKEGTKELRREVRGIKPRDMADAVLRQAEKDAEQNSNVVRIHTQDETYTTPALDAALEASFTKAPDLPEGPANAAEFYTQAIIEQEKVAERRASISVADEGDARYSRAKKLQAQIEQGLQIDEGDRTWLSGYLDTPEYRTRARMEADFGSFQKSK